ncbi:Hypothetical predicted protein [Olea europaea subsp. europaea]|uniref:Uncharacterized protein n=1 Tax=Olea europaea subsp. europaea TaxID=158383 RepID=A0A8S0T8B3_OLEEU|nr:Hypothetical predicted protein [Olea europaea subsp. europaea]
MGEGKEVLASFEDFNFFFPGAMEEGVGNNFLPPLRPVFPSHIEVWKDMFALLPDDMEVVPWFERSSLRFFFPGDGEQEDREVDNVLAPLRSILDRSKV